MKHYFIQQNYLPRLTLFFAGWGMDECPFMDYCSGNSDLLVCYDYRSLDFDFTLLQGYQEIRLIAWSMGVWAASMVLQDMDLPICESVALNGTVTPVDDLKGISQQVFEGTLEGLNEVTLEKFIRRMCLKLILIMHIQVVIHTKREVHLLLICQENFLYIKTESFTG